MQVEKTERSISELVAEISRSHIKLPELQRDYVWKPTQVAKLVDSLYRGYPSGSLLFWQTEEAVTTREMAVDGVGPGLQRPLYLLDGQQRLTSLYRVLTDHAQAQIVFQAEYDRFQNQSAATRADRRWIKVAEIVRMDDGLLSLVRRLRDAGCALSELDIEKRLLAVQKMVDRRFQMEILRDVGYGEVADIFVRVNSGGRHLGTLDLAMATLSARWPGVVDKLQKEADHWRRQGYAEIDTMFLSRALAGAVLGSGLSSNSHTMLTRATDAELEAGWDTVVRGFRLLVPLLKKNLQLDSSRSLPSLLVLIPPVIYLGERPKGPVPSRELLYWLLLATVRNRYGTSTDTRLSQDIKAVRGADPIRALLRNLDALQTRPQVTPESLAGRTKESPYFFLSLLATRQNGAQDWYFGVNLSDGAEGEQKLEAHHIHPQATLRDYDKGDVNDLANLAYISARANKMISDRSPKVYFPELGRQELAAHYIPLAEDLRDSGAYPRFVAERRRLLAEAMTAYLDRFRPDWLDLVPTEQAADTDGYGLELVLYTTGWDPSASRLVFKASGPDVTWIGSTSITDLETVLSAAGTAGIDGDIEIAGESVPVQVVDDLIEVPIGPFLVTGTDEEWRRILEREWGMQQALSSAPKLDVKPWTGDRIRFPVTDTD